MLAARALLAVVSVAAAGSPFAGGAAPPPAGDVVARPWLDSSAPIAQRVQLLLAAMTTEEKVNQTLNDYCTPGRKLARPSDPAGAAPMVCSDADIASEGMRYLFKFCGGKNASVTRTDSGLRHPSGSNSVAGRSVSPRATGSRPPRTAPAWASLCPGRKRRYTAPSTARSTPCPSTSDRA